MTAAIANEEAWPAELESLIEDLHIDASDVDVRFGSAILSHFWRINSSQVLLQTHVDRFKLTSVNPDGPESKYIRETFPRAWKWPEHSCYRCFANPAGMPYIPDGGRLVILMHDDKAQVLYCFFYFNF